MALLRGFCWLLLSFMALVGCTARSGSLAQMSGPGPLSLFMEDGRYGYLDSTGTVVLKPRFWAARSFTEGRAAVREGGFYGYIDEHGQYLLPPVYEYATDFVSGRALVWKAGRPWLIDRTGRALTRPGAYRNLEWEAAEPNRPPYLLTSGTADHHGVLDANGQILIDTLYNAVRYLGAGCFELRLTPLVRERNNLESTTDTTTYLTSGQTRVAMADRQGHILIPFGRYSSIQPFTDGRAVADSLPTSREAEYSNTHLLDSLGRIVATVSGQKYAVYDCQFQDSVLVTSQRPLGPIDVNADNYPAVLDRQGRLLFADTALKSLSPYHRGRALAESKSGSWFVVDKAGHRLNKRPFGPHVGPNRLNNLAPAFNHGVEVMRVGDADLQLIDSHGQLVGPVRHLPFTFENVSREGNLVVFSANKELPNGQSETQFGYWDLTTGLIVPPRFQSINAHYRNGVLPVELDHCSAYLNRTGQLLWQQPIATPHARYLNMDQLNRATYGAASPNLRRYRGAGGWGRADNQPKRLPGAPITPGQLRVSVAAQTADTLYAGLFTGHRLCISNATSDTVVFDAQDSMLDLVLQTRDPTGNWRDIEYLPSSFCGNSYHTLFLAPGQYWQLAVPAYTGSQPTHLRAKLTPRYARNGQIPRVWYSNEFTGSVNLAQFWRKRGYAFSNDIMNPYLN